MIWCSPILLRMLQHCIWDPWGAFGHILKEWMAIISVSRGQTYPIWLPGPGLALWPSSKGVCSSSMCWCFPILLPMLQHCVWDPWGAFGHILKEWMTIISVSRGQMYLIWLPGRQVWHLFGPLRKVFAPPACGGASQFFYACCNIAFG